MKLLLKYCLSTLAILSLFGCGSKQHVSMSHNPTTVAQGQAQAVTNGAKKIYLADFQDDREEKEDIGDLRNILFIKLSDVVISNDLSEVITAAVKQELEQDGFNVVAVDAGRLPSDAPALIGKVVNLTCCSTSLVGMDSKLTLDVELTKDGRADAASTYIGEGLGTLADGFVTQAQIEAALSEALDDAVKQITADVNGSLAL